MKKASVPLVFALVIASFLPACDRTHLSEHFGESNRRAYQQQVIDPKAGFVAKPDQPLDPEEAAIVAHTYQKSLSHETSESGPQQQRGQILVAPPLQPGAIGPGPAPYPGTTPR